MRMTADLKLGTSPSFSVDWGTKSRIGLPSYGIVARAGLLNTQLGWMDSTNEQLLYSAVDGYLEDSRLKNGSLRIGVTAEMNPYEHRLDSEGLKHGWDWKSYWLSGFGTFKYDTFDDGYFPTRGIRLALDGRYVFKGVKDVTWDDDELLLGGNDETAVSA
jgi:outer membrane protein assembly factor BamA